MLETRRIELRAAADGLVEGVAVRYGDIAVINGQPERFLPASLLPDAPELRFMHDDKTVLAETVKLIATPAQMDFEARIAEPYREPLRGLIASGLLNGASIGFRALSERMAGGVREIALARLEEISLVDIPAYPASHGLAIRRADDSAIMGAVEYRQQAGVIAGSIALGVAGIVSLQRRRKLMIPKDIELEFDPTGIFLYDGYDQSRPLASSASDAGSLTVRRTADAIVFATVARKLANTTVLREVRQKIRSGLMQGAVPGLGVKDSDSHVDADGFTVEVPRKAVLCHFNLTARRGDGYSGRLSSSGRRRRRGR